MCTKLNYSERRRWSTILPYNCLVIQLFICLSEDGILSLYNISKDTSGYYICTSSNKIRSAQCNITLAVMPREHIFYLLSPKPPSKLSNQWFLHLFLTTSWSHPPCSHHEPWIRWENYRHCRRCNRAHRNNRYRLLLLPPEEEATRCGICHGVGHERTHTHCDGNLCDTDGVEG